MISLAITTYNRSGLLLESFSRVLQNELIDEIVIVDDGSDIRLFKYIEGILPNTHKIKLYRNETNLGAFLNKLEAVKRCSNEWVILFDSDNRIFSDYIIEAHCMEKEEDTIYIPELSYSVKGHVVADFREFNETVTKSNVRTDQKFLMFLGMCNWLVNRKKYIEVCEGKDTECYAADSIYASYLWLLAGNKIKTFPANYIHRVHSGSYWNNTEKESNLFLDQLIKEFKTWV